MRIFMPRLLVPYEYHLQKGPDSGTRAWST